MHTRIMSTGMTLSADNRRFIHQRMAHALRRVTREGKRIDRGTRRRARREQDNEPLPSLAFAP